MTPEHRQELREWSAGLKGYHIYSGPIFELDITVFPCCISYEGRLVCFESNVHEEKVWWTPDLPIAPASQILGVIERMRELGWRMHFWCMKDDYRVAFFKEFRDWKELRERDYTKSKDFLEAILEAAWATGVGG